jgi:hypothetical protein
VLADLAGVTGTLGRSARNPDGDFPQLSQPRDDCASKHFNLVCVEHRYFLHTGIIRKTRKLVKGLFPGLNTARAKYFVDEFSGLLLVVVKCPVISQAIQSVRQLLKD